MNAGMVLNLKSKIKNKEIIITMCNGVPRCANEIGLAYISFVIGQKGFFY